MYVEMLQVVGVLLQKEEGSELKVILRGENDEDEEVFG
jgi:hypothetical protein